MSIIKEIEKDLLEDIKEAGYELTDLVLEPTSRPDLGDFQLNNAFSLAKSYHKSPMMIAEDIKKVLEKDERFTNINVANPGFINISLSNNYLVEIVNTLTNDFSLNIDKVEKKKVVVDYGGANVAKALHVGHLRSANIGEAVKRLANLLGYEAIGDAHLGDYGRPLGFVVLEIKKRYPSLAYFDENYKGDYSDVELPITNEDLEKIYPEASLKAKEDEAYLEEGRDVTSKIQSHVRGYYDCWKKVVEISKADIKSIYDMLDVHFELWLGESDSAEYFDEVYKKFEENNLVIDSEGAKIVEVKEDSDKAPMPPLLLIKSNGTISYESTDLTTIYQRKLENNPDEIWYLTDARQALHFEQVFRAAYKAKLIDESIKLEHDGFGTMNGSDGKPFKTRDGGVMPLKTLIDLVIKETYKKISLKDVTEEEKKAIAEKVAIASLKYADLLPYRGTDYIFDLDKFADLDGKTGAYILYSTIRMKSLLNKALELKQEKSKKIVTKDEKDIILNIINLPRVLTKSLEARSLNDIAEYLYKLTSLYNKFYSENRIITEEDEAIRESWLVLTKLVYDINMLLINTLGLPIPEKM